MCGIAGIVDFADSSEGPTEALLRRMLGGIRHRGPDAFGIYKDGHAGLAHARLSIIDLSGGDQPIYNEDKNLWLIFNGEIFNYPELREGLVKSGHRFYTRSDTEVLVHLYEEHGTEMFQYLNGQFAFALWDRRNECLLLCRDRLGVRPLFYHLDAGRLLFGSEIKAIFADPRVPRAINPQTLSDIFTCWAPLAPLTAFQDIYQVPPGHYALFSRDGMILKPYWKLSFSNSGLEGATRSLDDYTEELQYLLQDATRIRLRADVPVGAYLSGGLDSTYITSLVKHYFNNQLRTFSVAFTDGRFDETAFQEKAVAALQTDHRSILCTEQSIGESFPQVIWHTEVPTLRTAPAPLYQLSQLVRESGFKVVLTGEGADEFFAGYDIFKEDLIRRFWARQPDSKVRPKLLQKLYPDIFYPRDARAQVFVEKFFGKGRTRVDSPCYSHLIRWENTAHLQTFFSSDLQEATGRGENFPKRFEATLPRDYTKWDSLSKAQYTEVSIFLSNYLLSSQGDRVAMAHAVEGRFPFLDHRVVEFACKLPSRYRMHGLRDKFILRRAAANLIPSELSQRPKRPYRAPISRCFLGDHKHDYVSDLLSESALRRAGYFDPDKVTRLIDKCVKREGQLTSERENMALVGILSTQLLDHLFISHFSSHIAQGPEIVKIMTN